MHSQQMKTYISRIILYVHDIPRVAAFYQKQHGIAPEETIRQIREMIDTEFASPTSDVTGDFVE